jgi:Trypsin-like serine proteases, typically periplasmic, contain C-terminal PDZ domain
MRDTLMSINLSRGGAAAIFTFLGTLPLGAQGAVVRPSRVRDSSAVVQVLVMTKARMDSINLLMRSFEEARSGSAQWDSVRKQIEALMPARIELRRSEKLGMAMTPTGWIGINAGGVPVSEERRPDGYYVTYFAYPRIFTVDGQSPAQRAGIQPGDMLVAYNGLDIVGRPLNLGRLLVPDKKLGVTVRRDGETKEFALTVARTPVRVTERRNDFDQALPMLPGDGERGRVEATLQRNLMPGGMPGAMAGRIFMRDDPDLGNRLFVLSPNGVLGASLSTVNPRLAKVLNLEIGVLVNDVPEETVAWRSGLRPGDVIVNVAGQQVESLNQLRELILRRATERAVALRIIREKKAQDVNVTW